MTNFYDTPMRVELSDVQVGDKIRLERDGDSYEFTVSEIDKTFVCSKSLGFTRGLLWEVTLLERPLPPLPTTIGRYRAGVSYDGVHRFFMLDKQGQWWDIGNNHTPFMRDEPAENVARYGPLVPLVVSNG